MPDYLRIRAEKDAFLSQDHHSPIEDPAFEHLAYFDPDDALMFTVRPQVADKSPVTVQTSDGAERVYRRGATACADIDGVSTTITLYETPGVPGYFVPFRDATSGKESYGAGRYLDVEPNPDGTVTLDFNLAYNPYCAYSDRYSCPLPPHENWLTVAIRAGEKTYVRSDA